MKKIILALIIITVFSCKNEASKKIEQSEKIEVSNKNIPKDLINVFGKHGGLETWKKTKTLSFNLGDEVHTSDLQSRKIVINSPTYNLGFNGKETWLAKEDGVDFKKNPDFYYNLFFYFYAMPFVLADDGITYQKVDDLQFEGKNYPGYKISYNPDKGTSPDDNYFIYYNPTTYQMEWLGYTVTFKSKKPSNTVKLIRYKTWENVNGLILPKAITWYKKDKNGSPIEPARKPTQFTFPLLSKEKLADTFFEKPVN
jgi:hypothetical protein